MNENENKNHCHEKIEKAQAKLKRMLYVTLVVGWASLISVVGGSIAGIVGFVTSYPHKAENDRNNYISSMENTSEYKSLYADKIKFLNEQLNSQTISPNEYQEKVENINTEELKISVCDPEKLEEYDEIIQVKKNKAYKLLGGGLLAGFSGLVFAAVYDKLKNKYFNKKVDMINLNSDERKENFQLQTQANDDIETSLDN